MSQIKGKPDPMDTKALSRRNFFKTSGALAAAGALTACFKRQDPYSISQDKIPVPGSDKWYAGEEKTIASSCGQCPINCGIMVRVVEGRAVKINGNPNSLLVGGKLGPKGQTGLFTLYDPDRIQSPLKRDGERGSGKWKEISWEEAYSEVAAKLGALRNNSESHKLSVICGRERGFMRDLLERFCKSYGTPNFFDSLSTNDGTLFEAMELMMGSSELPGYDAANSAYILSLGAGIFESTCNGIHFARSQGISRRENQTRRTKIVQVEANHSLTAKESDEWIPIKVGTYDVLALGIANQLVKANLHDMDFINSYTHGFDKFLSVLEKYPSDKVSEITGIPEKDIYRLTWELAGSKPALVVVDARSAATSNGLEIARCALALNALLGNIGRPGGLFSHKSAPVLDWAQIKPDTIAQHGLQQPALDGRGLEKYPLANSVVDAFPVSVLSGNPSSTEALLIYYSNPLYTKNDPEQFKKAFDKIPFIVSFSPFMDESTFSADLILPDHTYLERWEDATPPAMGPNSSMGIRRPVVEPLYKSKNTGDVVIEIAQALGASVGESFPWKNFKEAMEERMLGLYNARNGSIAADDPEAFLKKLNKLGAWNDESAPGENFAEAFKTPSKKFEFYSQMAESKIRKIAQGKKKSPDEYLRDIGKPGMQSVCLPHSEEPTFTGTEAEFPLLLRPYKNITYAIGSGANIPYLRELAGLQKGLRAVESWRSWVEVHPSTAEKLGLERGDEVWVESPIGKIKASVLPTVTVSPSMALMALGSGHTQLGRFAKGKGANPKRLIPANIDPLSGLSPRFSTRVRITRA